jgi:excisionase family DNA binding protein
VSAEPKDDAMPELSTNFKPQILKVSEAAALLRVSQSTVNNWINAGAVPCITLPGGGRRIPLRGLIASLTTNYDLEGGLTELVASISEQGITGDQMIEALGGDPTIE